MLLSGPVESGKRRSDSFLSFRYQSPCPRTKKPNRMRSPMSEIIDAIVIVGLSLIMASVIIQAASSSSSGLTSKKKD